MSSSSDAGKIRLADVVDIPECRRGSGVTNHKDDRSDDPLHLPSCLLRWGVQSNKIFPPVREPSRLLTDLSRKILN